VIIADIDVGPKKIQYTRIFEWWM